VASRATLAKAERNSIIVHMDGDLNPSR